MASLFGQIAPPINNKYFTTTDGSGIFMFISTILKFAGVIGGLFFLIQLIIAGYSYIASNGDAKKIEASSNKVTQSVLGIVIIAGSTLIVGVVGRLLGINILNPTISAP